MVIHWSAHGFWGTSGFIYQNSKQAAERGVVYRYHISSFTFVEGVFLLA